MFCAVLFYLTKKEEKKNNSILSAHDKKSKINCAIQLSSRYVVLCFISSLVPMLGMLELELTWGTGIQDYCLTLYGTHPIRIMLGVEILSIYSAFEATIVSVLLLWNLTLSIFLLIELFTELNQFEEGIIVVYEIILLGSRVDEYNWGGLYFLSPLSWAKLPIYEVETYEFKPYIFNIILGFLLNTIICILLSLKQEVHNE